jgi:glucose/arabinose dehydrogenase
MSAARVAAPALLCALLVVASACGGSSSSSSNSTATAARRAASPASTSAAASPASATTATAQPVENNYVAQTVLPRLNFDDMLELKIIPGDQDHALLLTRDGVIRRASMADDSESPATFMDVSDRLIDHPGQEEGLLGLAFAPDYPSSGRFYLYFVAGNPRREVISRFTAAAPGTDGVRMTADPSTEQVLIEIADQFPNHNGGALSFGPDGMLYIGEGDGGSQNDPNGNGQNTSVLLGKIMRIDVSGQSYTVPPDNPFASGGGRGEIWAYGLRNPWRFNFDPQGGALWVADVGQNKWEEVDRVEKGGNYGWDIMEGNHCHEPAEGCDETGLILPRAEYSHSDGCSITGGYVYRGKAMRELDGWFLYSDYCSGKLWAVDTAGDAPPVLLADTKLSVSSFGQDKDGELYLVTFSNKIARITRK